MPRTIPNPQTPRAHGARDGSNGDHATRGKLAASILEQLGHGDSRAEPEAGPADARLDKLRAENAQLREIVADLQQMIEQGSGDAADSWPQRQKEYEALLEEKTETIRTLHLKVKDFEERQPAPPTPKEEELIAMNQDLERDRCQFQQERRQFEQDLLQFKEDKASMTEQMREMEVQMAQERAELTRQRNDIQRILEEIRHELERCERDRGLSDKLGQLRQRYHDVAHRRGAAANGNTGGTAPTPTAPAATPKKEAGAKKKEGGVIRRLFGQAK